MIIDLPFEKIFGSGASQDIESLTIQKADLPRLTPSIANNGQQLFVGLLARPLIANSGFITTPSGEELTSAQGVPITYDQSGLSNLSLKIWRIIPLDTDREIVLELLAWL